MLRNAHAYGLRLNVRQSLRSSFVAITRDFVSCLNSAESEGSVKPEHSKEAQLSSISSTMPMTSDAKQQLSKTIRRLRSMLLDDLLEETKATYLLTLTLKQADLNQAKRTRRLRLEAWLDEQLRAEKSRGKQQRSRDDFLKDVVKQAAYTLLNRMVFLRLLEGCGLRRPKVVTGGWNSPGYKIYRDLAPDLVWHDPTEGYEFLLKLIFEDMAIELPGLFGSTGLADLVSVPTKTWRAIVDALDDKELESCWDDDMTLGWVYQYWNDPEREALDDKINAGGKIEPHEIASKTQMFTERYMVDWLLQNSLGPMWLAMCRKHGWTPEVEADGTLERLEQRRIEWRRKRDAGEVSLTELMPLETAAERRWAYYVPQPIPEDAIAQAPESVWDLKVLDPAVGSGHFLVVAFDLLVALYEEEARHRTFNRKPQACASDDSPVQNAHASGLRLNVEDWSRSAITEHILSSNLHGIDLDARAVQIAAAALWLKGRLTCPEARPERLNLVASNLRLASLPDDDPALVELRRAVESETGIPAALTDSIVQALRGADHLGSLLKVDAAVEEAIARHEAQLRSAGESKQRRLFDVEDSAVASISPRPGTPGRGVGGEGPTQRMIEGDLPNTVSPLTPSPSPRSTGARGARSAERGHAELKASLLERLEEFLSRHSTGDDLGLRLRGEQLTAGVRFVRLVREGTYDLVIGNPPYQGTSKIAESKYIEKQYPLGKADLFAAFLLRGLQLVREGGVSALLTMRNWMFIKQYSGLRQYLLSTFDLRALGDFAVGAFDEVPNDVLSVTVSVMHRTQARPERSIAQQPTAVTDNSYDRARTSRKRAAVLCHLGRHTFDPAALKVVPEWPLVYWWDEKVLRTYETGKLLGESAPAKVGMQTANNQRFLRLPWEVGSQLLVEAWPPSELECLSRRWVPYVKGAAGKRWIEPLSFSVNWKSAGLECKEWPGSTAGAGSSEYFCRGVAFTAVGSGFDARTFRYPSIFDIMGTSIFPTNPHDAVCALNSTFAKIVVTSLNPTIHIQPGDVNRLPLFPIAGADVIFATVEAAFGVHESHREPSVEFKLPGPSPWRYAQEWAQTAVDRPEGAPLPDYQPVLDPEPPTDHLSFALGVSLGRFGPHGEGVLDGDGRVVPLPPMGNGTQETAGTNDAAENRGTLPLEPKRHATRACPSGSSASALLPGEMLSGVVQKRGNHPGERGGVGGAVVAQALPQGILFLDGSLDDVDLRDSLSHPATKPLLDAWDQYGALIAPRSGLRSYLREKFFSEVHKGMYENRPIHWPLSSEKKTFVAWVNIHRWNENTLRVLLAEHLKPRLTQLEGELTDLRAARDSTDKKASKEADRRLADIFKYRDELTEFIKLVETCAEKGPPPTDAACPAREVDARYSPDLDDGVMVNSAALWPLLLPQWKDPKKWWKELATSKGKKDYDWSHLAMRYWPTRVDEKCQQDPSLGVAHGCFWKYHPARAWAWELRLQDEIGPEFRIEEDPYIHGAANDSADVSGKALAAGAFGDRQEPAASALRLTDHIELRRTYLREHLEEALDTIEKEVLRRRRKKKAAQAELHLLEAGLWSTAPDECWELEMRIILKQEADFFLRAPDEPAARAAYMAERPHKVSGRQQRLDSLGASAGLFEDEEEEDLAVEDAEESDESDEE